MHLLRTTTTAAATFSSVSQPLLIISSHLSLSKPSSFPLTPTKHFTLRQSSSTPKIMNWLGRLGFGTRTPADPSMDQSSIAQGPDDDLPAPGQQFAQFGAGCFWGVELVFQRVPGVTKTEVGYTQGFMHNPTYNDICSGTTNHSEVVRVQYDPKECSYENLLDCFWERHDPTTLNRQVSCCIINSLRLRSESRLNSLDELWVFSLIMIPDESESDRYSQFYQSNHLIAVNVRLFIVDAVAKLNFGF